MATNFPNSKDNFPLHTDNNSENITAKHMNDVQDAIEAIETEIIENINTFIPNTDKGIPDGVATLDTNGEIPIEQIPNLSYIPTSDKGIANGVADLDVNGKVPTTKIPTLDYIAKALLTAQGDMIYASGAGIPAKISRGAGLQYFRMKSDGSIPEWATLPALGSQIATGTYTGALNYDITTARTITVGFTPKYVFLIRYPDNTSATLYTIISLNIFGGSGTKLYSNTKIVSNGFSVGNNGTNEWQLNFSGDTYSWIAVG